MQLSIKYKQILLSKIFKDVCSALRRVMTYDVIALTEFLNFGFNVISTILGCFYFSPSLYIVLI